MPRRAPSRAAGLTLVELLVALVIGLLLMGAALQVFLGSRLVYRETQRLAGLQEAIGYGVDYMVRDIRGAVDLATEDGDLKVTRYRDLAWCGVDRGLGTVFYHVGSGGLRCGDGGQQNHELVAGLKADGMTSTLIRDSHDNVIGVRVQLVFVSHTSPGHTPHTHPVVFHVALRNSLLLSMQQP
ncbi:type IV pilus assembly protein PilW [Ectothiorhodospira magna]|uniref:Type IV pilus assembly protein PilW n=2 Tax=Ectothiorhodospira magna TaxID=867345 RepID=A0A1H9CI64_9GAMM|nr:type IV pilus assembly protein PilW [Ectothiorhodospira magna]